MVTVHPVNPGEEGRRDSGTALTQKDRPQNPKENTTWTNPVTRRDEIFFNGVWTELQQSTALLAANNLSDVGSAATSRTNLGLGTAALQDANNFNLTGKFRISGIQAKSADYTFATTDSTVNGTGGAGAGITITLPAANSPGQICIVRKVDAGVGTVTVSRAGSDTIQGSNTLVLAAQYDRVILQSDGTSTWYRMD